MHARWSSRLVCSWPHLQLTSAGSRGRIGDVRGAEDRIQCFLRKLPDLLIGRVPLERVRFSLVVRQLPAQCRTLIANFDDAACTSMEECRSSIAADAKANVPTSSMNIFAQAPGGLPCMRKQYLMAVACLAMARLKSELPLLQTYLITRKVCTDHLLSAGNSLSLRKIRTRPAVADLLFHHRGLVSQTFVRSVNICMSYIWTAPVDCLPDLLKQVNCTEASVEVSK